ncbi:MAG: hypothetical protein IPL70_01790 [Uliginosibacterium sp.]|nr:hypothetical protein [Uliginosibacterium sp.]
MHVDPVATNLYALSAPGQKTIGEGIQLGMLYAFDFDGTLAPIVANPEQARPSQSVIRHMQILCELAEVAVVSGRRMEDVRERLGFTPHYLIGNHGIENDDGARDESADEIMTALAEVAGTVRASSQTGRHPGRGQRAFFLTALPDCT